MAPILDQILSLVAVPQGNLIYSLVMVMLVFGALHASFYASARQGSPEGNRIKLGFLYLFVVQMFMFLATWLVLLEVISAHIFLPPIDRTVALVSLILVIWLWAFPSKTPVVDRLVVAIEVVLILAGIFSFFWWMGNNLNAYFNTSLMGAYAYSLGIIFLVAGLIVLIWKRPISWEFGVAMLLILLGGYLAQYVFRQPAGDFPWLVRLGEMAGFIVLVALPRRIVPQQREKLPGKAGTSTAASRMDGGLIRSILELRAERSSQNYYQKLTQLIAHLMDAWVCLLMMPPKTGEQLIVPVGYNAVLNQPIEGFTVNGRKMPDLADAIRKGIPIRLDGTSADSEVHELMSELELKRNAHLLEVPFKPRASSGPMGLLVLSKSSRLKWSGKDELELTQILNALTSSIPHVDDNATVRALQQEAAKYRQAYAQVKAQFDVLNAQAKKTSAQVGDISELLRNQKNLQEMVKELESKNRELESLITGGRPSYEEVEQLRIELRSALEELARIPTTLSKSDQRMLELQLSAMKQIDDLGPSELVKTIAEKFRQPLSSIFGYTDLLLGESVGILGAMQRKFLERVKASTERLGMLMNELVQVLAINGGSLDLTKTTVDLKEVIDEAVASINAQAKENFITTQVDMPENLPAVQVNKDALQQILSNLLENACLASPSGGEIKLRARIEHRENEPDYLLISVTDQGGGIASEDIPRIFLRHYKMENPIIQGIGDTGVGLSIVKSLVELQKGRIWVETNSGVGSTFSCVLPLIMKAGGEDSIQDQTQAG